MKLIDTLKAHYSKGKTPSTFSLPEDIKNIIPKNMLQYLKRKPTDEQIDPYLFEFFVYQKMFAVGMCFL